MKISQLFTKTQRQAPADETAKNAQLLIQAGFIHKEMAGVYAFLPLGLRVVEKIKQIVRQEMDAIAGQELIMTNLQPKDNWETTGRWEDEIVDIWFKTKLKDDTEVGLAWSHEEPIVKMLKQHVNSYKDFPISVYQFQTKLRNELRSKSGIMRGREFVMKDMYSINTTTKKHDEYYNSVITAYKSIYDKLGIGKDTFVTFASGGAFTEFSHEFQTICQSGEDTIYLHKSKNIAINEEVIDDENLKKLGVSRDELETVKSSEVGNIFYFGLEKSKTMDFTFTDEQGHKQYPFLGSYGLGITRVMGVIVEKLCDERGMVWPESIAPFKVYIARLGEDTAVVALADGLYEKLQKLGVEVLYDDRDERAGTKFSDADLIGIPYRVVVSSNTVKTNKYELKRRTATEPDMLSLEDLIKKLAN